ncbi:isotocin receptor-like [Cylas formicarius]|uniref:isotocin receptor-like n=1 Tax=Cylas formicarius TaxID=197179 RepID=UPI00295864A2|nr:isotocin receptor-like [Cylas formicarius]
MEDKLNKITYLIDIAVPAAHIVLGTQVEKVGKYVPIGVEVKTIWNQEKVVILGATDDEDYTGAFKRCNYHRNCTLSFRRHPYWEHATLLGGGSVLCSRFRKTSRKSGSRTEKLPENIGPRPHDNAVEIREKNAFRIERSWRHGDEHYRATSYLPAPLLKQHYEDREAPYLLFSPVDSSAMNTTECEWEFEFRNYTVSDVNCTSSAPNRTSFFEVTANPNVPVILVYSALFVTAAIGNLTVFISLFRSRHRKSRVSLMIRNLAVADLIVTFVMIPIEVGWRLTGRWVAGNVACKIVQFLRALGPYLSSNVLICVSLDRYFAVMYPFRVNVARRRGKVMLAVAWCTSLIYCIPQCFVFRVKSHPHNPDYKQCVTFGYFSSTTMELVYNLSCVLFLYFIPLIVIVVAYTCIMLEISRNSKLAHESKKAPNGRLRLRRSDTSNIQRARIRTLRMTITIVAIYIFCCTPYVIMTLWYMFDRKTAQNLPDWLQDFFFMMVVSNSCMNPMVYGSYVIDFKRLSDCNCCRSRKLEQTAIHDAEPGHRKEHRHFARTVIKAFFGRKVNSTTKSTGTQQGQNIRRIGANNPAVSAEIGSSETGSMNQLQTFPFKSKDRIRNANEILSFHSEPCESAPCHSSDGTLRRNSCSTPLKSKALLKKTLNVYANGVTRCSIKDSLV